MRQLVHSLEKQFDIPAASPAKAELLIDIDSLLRSFRRQAIVFFSAIFVALFAGGVWLLLATPLYTADTFVLIDNRRVHAVEDSYDAQSQVPEIAGSLIDSQVEIVKSDKLAKLLATRLNLLNDPKFNAETSAPSFLRRIWQAMTSLLAHRSEEFTTPENANDLKLRGILDQLRSSVEAHRVGRTMVLQISYTSKDPAQSARLANAYAEAYLADQLDTKYESTKRASQWLEGRIEELKQKALESDLEIQKFKKDHDLISSGGKLVNEQQLAEVNTQLVLARAETAKAEAHYSRISAIIKNHQTDAVVAEAIGSSTVAQLRNKYLDLAKREADISASLGRDHLQAINLRKEMGEYERLMFEELGRLAESAKSDVDIAKTREQSLLTSLEKLVILNATENTTLVKLHEMEREAEAYQKLHQTYLQRYQEALQQQSFPIIEARVITSAVPPRKASSPKKMIALIMFGFLGAAVGFALGFIREFRERGLRGEREVKEELGLECLGILPKLKEPALLEKRAQSDQPGSSDGGSQGPAPGGFGCLHKEIPIFSYVLDHPRSEFAETLLATKLSADLALSDETTKVIGVISALPNEGKSVASKNLASMIAALRFPTLLIDADLRGREITQRLLPGKTDGLVEAILEKRPLEELLWWEKRTGLAILASTAQSRISHSSELLSSNGMTKLLEEARERFKYIILDLPPLGPIIDVRAMGDKIDAFVFVVEWRATPRKLVHSILQTEDRIARRCLGIILNKVEMKEIRLFEDMSSRHYYMEKYHKYYGHQ